MPQQPTDPQILSKVLRTKLGLSWDPQWDHPQPLPEMGTMDQPAMTNINAPQMPMQQVTQGPMLRARMQPEDMQRRLPLVPGPTM